MEELYRGKGQRRDGEAAHNGPLCMGGSWEKHGNAVIVIFQPGLRTDLPKEHIVVTAVLMGEPRALTTIDASPRGGLPHRRPEGRSREDRLILMQLVGEWVVRLLNGWAASLGASDAAPHWPLIGPALVCECWDKAAVGQCVFSQEYILFLLLFSVSDVFKPLKKNTEKLNW